MIVDWIAQGHVLLVTVAVVFAPGLLIGAALRLRGLVLWALAPAASLVVLSVLAIGLGAAGVAWSALSAGIGCLVAVAIAFGAGIALGPRRPRAHARWNWPLAAGIGVGAVLGLARIVLYIGEPGAVSQTNDAVFHLNALRWIVETGSASSLDLSGVTGSRAFYPGAWHATTSLVVMVSGASIPVAVNMVSLVIAAGVWPLTIAWLTREASRSAAAAATAAALSPVLIAFPMLMLEWGVLYPYLLSVALLPAAVAVVVAAPRWIGGDGPVEGVTRATVHLAVLLLGALSAIAFSQPATLLAWAILALSFATWWAVPRAARAHGRRRIVLVSAISAFWLVLIGLWIALTRSTSGSHWPPFQGKLAVIADVMLNGQVMLPYAVGASVLMLFGLVVAVLRPDLRWLASAWIIVSGLYVVAAAIGQPFLRRWLVGAWYADPYRLAAVAPVVVIPLAAIGLTTAIGWLLRRRADAATRFVFADRVVAASREPEVRVSWWAVSVATVVGLVSLALAPVVMMPKVIEREWDAESRYAESADSWLSPDERALLEQLDELVPGDARVIGNPSTGTGFGYMLSGRDVFPRTWAHPRTGEWGTIQEGLRDAGTDQAVCDALEVYGDPEFVLDFGEGEETPGRFILPGMTDFDGQPGFELVAEVGDASLWRITACG